MDSIESHVIYLTRLHCMGVGGNLISWILTIMMLYCYTTILKSFMPVRKCMCQIHTCIII